MSPKSLALFLVVALCATQMVTAHREARGVADLLESAKNKLTGLIGKVEDAAQSSVETVWNYIQKLENQALNAGTQALEKAGIQVNLTAVAGLFKDNIKICATDETVKKDAKVIIDNVASCVTKDVNSMKNLIEDMKDLWETAQDMPAVMQDVAKQCGVHSDTDVTENALVAASIEDDDNDLSEEANQLIENASHHLSKRAIWGLGRVTNCIQSVYGLTKTDLVTIPAEIVSTAANAWRVMQGAQGGIQACVAKRVTENVPAITKLGLSVSSCIAAGVSEGEDLDSAIESSPSLAALKQLSYVADQLQSIQNSSALNAASKIADIVG